MARNGTPSPEERLQKQSRISVERYFEVSLLLMLSTSFLTLATTGKLDFVAVGLVSIALAVRLWGHIAERDLRLAPRTVTRIAIFYIFFFGLDFLIFSAGPTVLDSMLAATVHLVLFATVIKVFSARTYRDYAYLVTLSFMMMLASAILTVSTVFLAFFTIYMLFAISTFISYEIKRSTEAAVRPPEGPFPAALRNRKAIEKSLSRITAGLAVAIVILAAGLFFVIPRYHTGYLTGVSLQTQNITGFSESVNLGDVGKLLRSGAVVMRIIPDGDPRQYHGIKWRGVGLNSFDGKHWYNDNTDQMLFPPASSGRFEVPRPPGLETRPQKLLHYRVLLGAVSTNILFVAEVPEEIFGRIRMLALDQTHSVHNPGHMFSSIQYNVISQAGLPPAAELRHAPGNYSRDIRFLYLRLPPTLDPRVKRLAEQVTAQTTNNYDRALAVQNYLRQNFGYTLNPAGIQSSDPIASFLFNAKKGYCEYFASAMAIMLRTIGVASRLVNGFQTGTYNRYGKDFTVRARDAHSWVEVYFPGYGWIPFDPTPADPHPVIPSEWDDYLDAASLFWNEWVINYDFSHQVRLAREFEMDSRQIQRRVRFSVHGLQRRGIRMAYRVEGVLMSHKLMVLLIMAAAFGVLVLGERGSSISELRFLWKWRFGKKDGALSRQEATLTYLRFLAVLNRKGYRRPATETPEEFAQRIEQSPLGTPSREFTRLYNASRFGRAPVPLNRLRSLLNDIQEARRN
jgi:protein-glutamine gamma-glutamyltransferase